jgi:hypothetical protein
LGAGASRSIVEMDAHRLLRRSWIAGLHGDEYPLVLDEGGASHFV